MVREVLSLGAGQAGNQISDAFWGNAAVEHGLNPATGEYTGSEDYQLHKIGVFFKESATAGSYVPRSVNFDLEPGVIEKLLNGPNGKLFKKDLMIHGKSGAGNNWAKGHYTEGAELIDAVTDLTRKEAEDCDCLQGFMLSHSIGGGTGSGMGTLLVSRIREEYPDKIMSTYSVFPSPKVSDVVVEPYNAVLSIHQLIENVDEVSIIDNEALYDILFQRLKITKPTFKDLNMLVSYTMTGTTACLRFPGQLNSDLRKLGVNLIPFPRLHFFQVSCAPVVSAEASKYTNMTTAELTKQAVDPGHIMAAVDPRHGKFLTMSLIYRGKAIPTVEVDKEVVGLQQREAAFFADWIPNNIKTSICNVPPNHAKTSCSMISNNTATRGIFERIHSQFSTLLNRKAYMHWYTGEGMDEMEFTEAESNLQDLINEYEQYENATMEDEAAE